jgi:hypothetical protein
MCIKSIIYIIENLKLDDKKSVSYYDILTRSLNSFEIVATFVAAAVVVQAGLLAVQKVQ